MFNDSSHWTRLVQTARPARRLRIMGILTALTLAALCLMSIPVRADAPTFDSKRKFGTGNDTTASVVLGDVDGDGDLDLISGNDREQNSVYLNDGGVQSGTPGNFSIGRLLSGLNDSTKSVAVGDVDGDGDLDLIIGNDNERNVIYLNDGGAQKGVPGDFSTSRPFGDKNDSTRSVALGDVDGDGDLDIVAGNWNRPNMIYLNDGGLQGGTVGNFSTNRDFGPGDDSTISVALGDVDGDGDLDIAVGNPFRQNVVYLNDGGLQGGTVGNFPPDSNRNFGTENDSTWSMALGDVDGDGDLDIVTGNAGEQNAIYLNDGKGNFADGRIVSTWEDQTMSVALGDVDGDGDLDIVTGNAGEQNVIYLNDGKGNFVDDSKSKTEFGTGSDQTMSVTVGDVDNDGDLDLITGNVGERAQNVIYLNNGGSNLSTFNKNWGTGNDNTTSVAVGDVDNDGDLDLITGNRKQQNIVYLNDGGLQGGILGSFPVDSKRNFGPEDDLTSSVAAGDVDGDGDIDLVTGNDGGQNIVSLNDGGVQGGTPGNFSIGGNREFGTGKDQTKSVALGDMDGDGDLDIATGNYGEQNVIYLNDGKGNFVDGNNREFGTVEDRTYSVAAGDIDNDGDLDLIVGNWGQPNTVCLNDGKGNFDIDNNRSFGAEGEYTWSVALGDVDGDGDLDIVTGNDGGQNIIYLNDGGTQRGTLGNFYTSREFGTGGDRTYQVALGDIDGDGDLDLITANRGELDTIYLNDGEGNFSDASKDWNTGNDSTWCVALGDVDGDGDLDLVGGDNEGQNIIYVNGRQGHRLLPNNAPFLTVSRPITPAVASFYAPPQLTTSTDISLIYTLFDLERDQIGRVEGFYSFNGGGQWFPAVVTTNPITTNRIPTTTVAFDGMSSIRDYRWNTFTSDFFGQSDNVVFRLLVYSQPPISATTGTYRYTNTIPGPYQWPYASATTFPFRVRGTQVQVYSETKGDEAAGAYVYRLPEGQSSGGFPFAGSGGEPFHTDEQGYLLGRGTIALDDQLLALLPVTTVAEYVGVLTFDGVNDVASVEPVVNAPITETTISLWVSTTQSRGTLFAYASPIEDATLALSDPGGLTIWRGNAYSITTPITVTDGLWHHLAVTWCSSDGQVKLYKDSVAAYTSTLALGTMISPDGQLILGFNQNISGSFKGTLDDVHLWTTVLDECQIRDAMYSMIDNTQANLVGAWTFDDPENPGIDQSLNSNDLILSGAMWDGEYTGGYTVYHTSGKPNTTGVTATTVTTPGVQELTVTADRPLMLFDLSISLEWDAHNDPVYLQQLAYDLKAASEYLYDFTNGQVALGHITVYQNADHWASAHIAVETSNRLRPFAHIGGLFTDVVTETTTVDGQDHILTYGPGQIRIGATWNRYGDPAQSIGVDWPLILAHELSHYLLYQYDVYIGVNQEGLLMPEATCTGSAMGDVYAVDNTEFISDTRHWTAACSQTLAAQTLGRTEWETLRAWYPWLITPTVANEGPNQMPFAFTTVEIVSPTIVMNTLEDPTFYLEYEDGGMSSSEARAFLLRDADDFAPHGPDDFEYIYDLGSPIGGQNRLLARGARPGDRLCVFDNARAQFGCEIIEAGDERLALKANVAWQPVIQLTPVNSTTFVLQVTELLNLTSPLKARIFPEFGTAFTPTTLAYTDGLHTASFTLPYPVMSGHVQVWVDEPASETSPRREAMVDFSIGGNPGTSRVGGIGTSRVGGIGTSRVGGIGTSRVGGIGTSRVGGIGTSRVGGIGSLQTAEAPLVSSDGQMILYSSDVITFAEGQFYTIQAMTGLPAPPAGRTLVGQGYNLVATGFPTEMSALADSVSIQYLGNDALVAGVYDEDDLDIYFWDGIDWTMLDTILDTYFNMASARSEGPGIYALMASVKLPLYGPGWNLLTYPIRGSHSITQALASISGSYTSLYGYTIDDASDPYKVYDVAVPEWVNDLSTLAFSKGYWINVSKTITLHLSSSMPQLTQVSPENGSFASPPDTFYGLVLGNTTFTPGAGMTVEAHIRGAVCGHGGTQDREGQIVYVISVQADDSIPPECGNLGDTVIFYIEGRPMAPTAVWDNAQLNELTLAPASPVYPLLVALSQAKWILYGGVIAICIMLFVLGFRRFVRSRD